jgi:hypothetical protein
LQENPSILSNIAANIAALLKREVPMPHVQPEQVARLLTPALGLPLLESQPGLTMGLTAQLNSYWCLSPRPSPDELAGRLESALFNGVYAATGGSMFSVDAVGNPLQVRTADLPLLADALLELLFISLPVNGENFELLNSYAMRRTSLAAMKCLYLGYDAFMPAMNRDIFRRVIQENFPPAAYAGWLQ